MNTRKPAARRQGAFVTVAAFALAVLVNSMLAAGLALHPTAGQRLLAADLASAGHWVACNTAASADAARRQGLLD